MYPEFTEEEIQLDPILKGFAWEHLQEPLATVSRSFCAQAQGVIHLVERSPERTVALRKLLESKDAAVRAKLWEETPT